ncbi:MAG: DUF1801 domain-containing protein [Weeksellaceae bacterium]
MLKPTDAKTPQEYIEMIEEPRRSEIIELDKLIQSTIPEKPFMMAGMLAYGKTHYKYASGREGDWSVIVLASQKNYLSLYACATDGQHYLAEDYKNQLPKASIGKSCIRFKKLEHVDQTVLKEIITKSYEMMKKDLVK